MLIELTAENIAIVDRATLGFGPGFTAVTGETGAGKSLLVGAISLCLGERADSDFVRTGASRAVVQAVFEPGADALTILVELGFEPEDGLLYIQREVAAEGRSQCRINGKLAPVSALKRIGDALADLHGQHEHQSLLNPASHLGILDAWIGEPAAKIRNKIGEAWRRRNEIRKELSGLERDEREREQRLDLLRFQVNELEEAAVRAGEIAELETEIKRLKNAEHLTELIKDAATAAYSGEPAARDLLSEAVRSLDAALEFDPRLKKAAEALRTALYSLDEAIADLREQEDGVEFDPQRLEDLAARQDTIARLKRKYGDTEDQIIAFLEEAKTSLEKMETSGEHKEKLAQELAAADDKLNVLCSELSTLRAKTAARMTDLVVSELRDLAMPAARFSASITPTEPNEHGADAFEFLFSANPGEPEKPLAKIASGGEISRVMLAIKTVLAGKGGVPTLIFDEVDAGLGGQTAAIVAKKLESLAQSYQVIVITHVPQIAGRAGSQISVEKRTHDGRSVAVFRPLKPEERVEEIARMLGGEKVGAAAIENARQLLGA